MRKTFEVERPENCRFWIVSKSGLHHEWFPAEFRAFDKDEGFRRMNSSCGILYIDDPLQMLVAVDWLLERDWELDLSRCDAAFLAVYPVTAAPPVPLECVRCRGDGVIYITLPPVAGYHDDGSRECPDCEGTGIITEEATR
jgi:hypothetical protein